jgi:hypothetical protein
MSRYNKTNPSGVDALVPLPITMALLTRLPYLVDQLQAHRLPFADEQLLFDHLVVLSPLPGDHRLPIVGDLVDSYSSIEHQVAVAIV